MRIHRGALAVIVAAGSLLVAQRADACSCGVIYTHSLYPKAGAIPANGVLAVQAHLDGDLKIVHPSGSVVPHQWITTYDYTWCQFPISLIRPSQALEVGATYRLLNGKDDYDAGTPLAEFSIEPPVEPDVQVTFDVEIVAREPFERSWVCGTLVLDREAVTTAHASSQDRLFLFATTTSYPGTPSHNTLGPVLRLPNESASEPLRADVPSSAQSVCVSAEAFDERGVHAGSHEECFELSNPDGGGSNPDGGGVPNDGGGVPDGSAAAANVQGGGTGCHATPRLPSPPSTWIGVLALAGAIALRRRARASACAGCSLRTSARACPFTCRSPTPDS